MRFAPTPGRLNSTEKGAENLRRTSPKPRCKECKRYGGTAWGIPICEKGLRWPDPDPGQGGCKSFEVKILEKQ